ncbi:MAG: hypothetical protein JKX74_07950 [Flavobacteriales bacterium]|nr:hypothetical protein [Flavobacteriales bacterium]
MKTIGTYPIRLLRIPLLSIVYLMIAGMSFGQNNKIPEALKALKDGNLNLAKELIDAAAVHEETSKSAATWYYRGYIYYELYKRDKKVGGPERGFAIDYFKKSVDIESDGKYGPNSKTQITNIARTFYNDCVIYLNSKDPENAHKSFDIFLAKIVIADPTIDLKPKMIDVYLALGGMYTNLYELNKRTNSTYWVKAKSYFERVLTLDENNLNGNYNIGILYYNKAVNIINGTDYDIDLVALSDIQDTSITLFMQSLPFMETAVKLEPENENTLIGLSGIYFALNEHEKSEEIKQQLRDIKSKENK